MKVGDKIEITFTTQMTLGVGDKAELVEYDPRDNSWLARFYEMNHPARLWIYLDRTEIRLISSDIDIGTKLDLGVSK